MASIACQSCEANIVENENQPKKMQCGCSCCDACSQKQTETGNQLKCKVHGENQQIKTTQGEAVQGHQNIEQGQSEKSFCQQHSEPLKYFCKTDQKKLCGTCFINDHKDHEYQTLEKEAEEKQKIIKEELTNIVNHMQLTQKIYAL